MDLTPDPMPLLSLVADLKYLVFDFLEVVEVEVLRSLVNGETIDDILEAKRFFNELVVLLVRCWVGKVEEGESESFTTGGGGRQVGRRRR